MQNALVVVVIYGVTSVLAGRSLVGCLSMGLVPCKRARRIQAHEVVRVRGEQ